MLFLIYSTRLNYEVFSLLMGFLLMTTFLTMKHRQIINCRLSMTSLKEMSLLKYCNHNSILKNIFLLFHPLTFGLKMLYLCIKCNCKIDINKINQIPFSFSYFYLTVAQKFSLRIWFIHVNQVRAELQCYCHS